MFDFAIIAAVSAHLTANEAQQKAAGWAATPQQGNPLQQHLGQIAHQQNTNAINNPQEWPGEPEPEPIRLVESSPMMQALMAQLDKDRNGKR